MIRSAAASSAVGKRIVLLDPSGMHTIVGREDADGNLPTLLSLPVEAASTGDSDPGFEMLHFNLIQVKTRFALYRQIVVPPTARFNDTFDPAQV